MLGVAMPKNVLRYALMPEVTGRFRTLFFSGFGYVPYFLATVYQMVGLIARNHPYLLHDNIGRYGIRHVVAEAAQNITFSFKTIDQVILFFAVLIGLVVFGLQFISLLAMLFLQPALALPASWTGFFTISNPIYRQQDLASMMLDMVFGVPYAGLTGVDLSGARGFFQSCVTSPLPCLDNFGTPVYQWNDIAGATQSDMPVAGALNPAQFGPLSSDSYNNFPFPYHLGLHRLLAIYSNGLLVVAMLITTYFVATVLAETAQSGVPFGRRFNKTWAPLRIVIAFGLLIPMGSGPLGLGGGSVGLNSSQYLVLYAAKFGSAFASNGWRYFNDTLISGFYGNDQDLVSTPNLPAYEEILQFMFTAQVCKTAYDYYRLDNAQKEALKNGTTPPADYSALSPESDLIHPHVLGPHSSAPGSRHLRIEPTTSYNNVMAWLPNNVAGNTTVEVDVMVIRFGTYDAVENADFRANVRPYCGEIHIPLTETRSNAFAVPGPYLMQAAYYQMVRDFWYRQNAFSAIGIPIQTSTGNRRDVAILLDKMPNLTAANFGLAGTHDDPANALFAGTALTVTQIAINAVIATATTAQSARMVAEGALASTAASPLYTKGWAAAGIWYNSLSELNGSMTSSVNAKPTIATYPEIMERVAALKGKYNNEINPCTMYKPEVTGLDSPGTLLDGMNGMEFASALWAAFNGWGGGGNGSCATKGDDESNITVSIMKTILGVEGLYALRKNEGTHPLAMLSGVGRSLVESSIRSVGWALIIKGGSALGVLPKQLAGVSASFFVSVAMMGLIVGFVLFYVVPFLPFIYFFFAVGGWIKGIFEALVGAPLWALAHIRIDGQGLPGSAAMNGYFLIFEVFLRPILVVFGLLASISIYSALVNVLNSIFTLAVSNLGGWIKGIFEALVGAPLWALAHIRIDGQGLPGSAAMNGYFLIFEVFLRPILVVFGLLASISIYSALVNVLNSIFTLAVSNLGGFDITEGFGATVLVDIDNLRSVIDEFFFTVIYAIIVYMLGMSSFKLIDTIPNNILRWMGQSVATFGDQRENPAEALVGKASMGSQQAVSKIGGGLQKVVG